jgi:hypothetical protein
MADTAAVILTPDQLAPQSCGRRDERTTPPSNPSEQRVLSYRYAEVGVYGALLAPLTGRRVQEMSKRRSGGPMQHPPQRRRHAAAVLGWAARGAAGGVVPNGVKASLRAPTGCTKIGMLAGNCRTWSFAKRDGVHGMVAGSTGSGKSGC